MTTFPFLPFFLFSKFDWWSKCVTNWKILPGNTNPWLAVVQQLDHPFVAERIRFLPYSHHPRTTCMRVEIYGCQWTGKNKTNPPTHPLLSNIFLDRTKIWRFYLVSFIFGSMNLNNPLQHSFHRSFAHLERFLTIRLTKLGKAFYKKNLVKIQQQIYSGTFYKFTNN